MQIMLFYIHIEDLFRLIKKSISNSPIMIVNWSKFIKLKMIYIIWPHLDYVTPSPSSNIRKAELVRNFPFKIQRENQKTVLDQICDTFNSGFKYIILEAPTGFGKSAVAITLALSLGSSYICTSTKDLQTQYSKDFPYIKTAKGKNNFPCLLKQDL